MAVVGSKKTTVVDPKPTLVERLRLEPSPRVGPPHKKSKRGVGPGPSKELLTKLLLELLPKLGISGISTGGAADDDAGAAAGAATDAGTAGRTAANGGRKSARPKLTQVPSR
mmetsp:Transcript_48920/g.131312  ORF Transcript_48920/g.131312 Transcript_48920/m.131312 type:complete len:112 (-) Transcript_48920:115-450(-)